MIAIAIFAVVALAAVAYWLVSRRESAQDRRPSRDQPGAHDREAEPAKQRTAPRYAGVEIQVRESACEAALAMSGQRYLVNEAPSFPLAACTATKCQCSFVKFSDRRTEERRLDHAGLGTSLIIGNNRRQRTGRREED